MFSFIHSFRAAVLVKVCCTPVLSTVRCCACTGVFINWNM